LKLLYDFRSGYRRIAQYPSTALASRQSCFQRVDPCLNFFNVHIDRFFSADTLVTAAQVRFGNCGVNIHPRHRGCPKASGPDSTRRAGAISGRGWKRPFDDPIPLPRGRQLVILEDAAK
jgi:hypothetical protein